MKKIVFTILIFIIVLPLAAFAEVPLEPEVQETTGAVLATFGLLFLSSMFGETPPGVEFQADDINDGAVLLFKDFDIKSYYQTIAEMEDLDDDADLPELYFSKMSGSISVRGEGDIDMDVNLIGGNIRNLKLRTSEETLEYLTADGRDYSQIEGILE